jgi:hypothetical protein
MAVVCLHCIQEAPQVSRAEHPISQLREAGKKDMTPRAARAASGTRACATVSAQQAAARVRPTPSQHSSPDALNNLSSCCSPRCLARFGALDALGSPP